MQNKFKLPSDVRLTAIGIVRGQTRRINGSRQKNNTSNESTLTIKVNNALEEVCADIADTMLKSNLQNALLQNCMCKQNVYEHYNLPGISRKSFYYRKNKLLYLVAKSCNIV